MFDFSNYNKILLALFFIVFSPMALLTLYMEPVSNELTRMGGYLENDFGWNEPQEHFEMPMFTLANDISEYDSYYDVVVFGDSFSEDLSHGWQNYFNQKTGLKIITFNMNQVNIDSVLGSEIYQNNPPKIFVYQSVERNIVSRNQICLQNKQKLKNDYIKKIIEIDPHEIKIQYKMRNREKLSLGGLDLNSTINYLKKSFSRNVFGKNTTEVHNFSLKRKDLFSNKKSASLLVITRDFKLKDVTHEQIKVAQCSLLALQQRIRNNGRTEFIALFFPDKTTTYSDFLIDERYAGMSVINNFEKIPKLNSTLLVDVFKNRVEQGDVDFYLPNDTHCGFQAYKLAAEAVLARLHLSYK